MTETLQGLFWSKEDAQKALSKHSFIRVSNSDKRSQRQISGAERVWSVPETQDEIYLIRYRISGKSDDIKSALLNAGYPASQVELALAEAVTFENYKIPNAEGGRKEDYDHELEKLHIFRQEEKEYKARQNVDWSTLLKIAANTKRAHIIMKERTGSPRKTSRGRTLIEKFDDVQGSEGKIIDVSNLREDGKGTTIRGKPTTERAKGVYIPGVPIISNSQEKYLRALEMLYENEKFGSESDYQGAINAAQAKFSRKAKSE